VVENLELPPEGHRPRPLAEVNTIAKPLLDDPERLMVAPDGAQLMEESEVRAYEDPALSSKKVRLALACRLWKSGMLTVVDVVNGVVSLFAVVKKVVPQGESWVVKTRLIFDHRKGNLQWRKPPWTALSGPEVLSSVDFADPSLREMSFGIGTGDVPNWYYVLRVPDLIATYFAFLGVTPAELRQALLESGWTGPLPSPTGSLAFCVLVMGWRWAVWLAETTLECLVHEVMPEDRHLIPGARIPRFSADPMLRFAYWTYVDDFGVMGFAREGEADAVEMKNRIRGRLREAGFDVHKEEEGVMATVVGVQVGIVFRMEPSRTFAAPPAEKFWILFSAIGYICRVPVIKPSIVESVLGVATWFALLARGTFSVFQEIYAFVRTRRRQGPQVLPMAVKQELLALRALMCFLVVDLEAPWVESLFMCDASPSGGALVASPATLEEIMEEATWSSRTGWLATRSLRAQAAEITTRSEPVPRPTAVRVWRWLSLCCGPPDGSSIGHFLNGWASEEGELIVVDVVDLNGIPEVDLQDRMVAREIIARASVGYWDGACAEPPSRVWRRPGASALVPPESYMERPSWDRARRVLSLCCRTLSAIVASGGVALLRWRPRCPSAWSQLPSTGSEARGEELESSTASSRWSLDALRKWLTTPPWSVTLRVDEQTLVVVEVGVACAGWEDLTPLIGEMVVGSEVANPRASADGNLVLASVAWRLLRRPLHRVVKVRPEDLKMKVEEAPLAVFSDGVKISTPPLPAEFSGRHRGWRELWRCHWSRVEPSNVVEYRTAAMVLQHLARVPKFWSSRVLLAVDNQCALALLGKGRSQKPLLLRVSRRVAAWVLPACIRVVCRWVPSKRNVADGPSRGRWIAALAPEGEETSSENETEEEMDLESLSELEILQRLLADPLPAVLMPGAR